MSTQEIIKSIQAADSTNTIRNILTKATIYDYVQERLAEQYDYNEQNEAFVPIDELKDNILAVLLSD